MRSFNIEDWIKQFPERFANFLDFLTQPVPIAIFCILGFVVWHKLKLGRKLSSIFHKFFKLLRAVIVIGLILLVASFFQYINSDDTSKENRENINEQITNSPEEIEAPKNIVKDTPDVFSEDEIENEIVNESSELFEQYVFLLPNEEALQNDFIERNYNEGLILQEKGRYKEAIKYFTKVIKHSTRYAFPYCARGIVYAKIGNYRRALRDFDEIISKDSEIGEVFNNRAVVLIKQRQFHVALRDFNNAIYVNKTISQIYINRGYLHFILHDYEESIYDWKRAIYINENYNAVLDPWLKKAYDRQ